MDNLEVNNRIAHALKMRGLKAVDLVEKTGIRKSTMSGYINQKYQPKQRALMAMARALDVSELWLAGYDIPMERPIEQKRAEQMADLITTLRKNDKLKDLCISISKLNDAQQSVIENMVNELIKLNAHQQ